jgi:iron complex outermembrane receptor protein
VATLKCNLQAAPAVLLIGALAPIAGLAADTASAGNLQQEPAVVQTQQPASSQTDTLDTVVVTGIVGSINRSIGIKRDETAIVDAVSAEDVGKFPDTNIAESLQRITGVEITRDANGEGQYVSVRGLPTDFTYFTFNGMAMSSIAGQGSRSFDYSLLTTDFISSLSVYKSSRADLDEGGIAANVNIKTITPFALGKERTVLSAKLQGDPGGYDNHNYPEITGIYSNIFADGVFGATVGFDLNKRASLNETTTSSPGAFSNYCLDPTDQTNANRLCTGGTRHIITQYQDKGSAANVLSTKTGYLSLQWKPIDSTVATLDGFYARKETDSKQLALFDVPDYPYGTNLYNGPPLSLLSVDKNNYITAIDEPNTWLGAKSTIQTVVGTTNNLSLNFDTTLRGWEFNETAQYSKSSSDTIAYIPQFGIAAGLPGGLLHSAGVPLDAGYQIVPGAPVATFLLNPSIDYSNPRNWANDEITYNRVQTSDELNALQLAVTRAFDAGPIRSVEIGARVYRRELPTGQNQYYYDNNNRGLGDGTPFYTAVTPVPFGKLLPDYTGSGVPAGGIPFIDGVSWLNQYYGGSLANFINSGHIASTIVTNSDIIERAKSAYLMANFRFDNPLMPISGNVGLRYQKTDTEFFYNGFLLSQVLFNPLCGHGDTNCQRLVEPNAYVSQSGSNHALLPSLNLVGNLRDDMVLRFAASKTMARPTLTNLNPTTTINDSVFTITSGNPNLAPFTSINYDLSYEWYFRPTSVVSIALYDKQMSNFIQQVIQPYILGGAQFEYYNYVNGSAAYVRGFELDYKQIFDFLPTFWSGFGFEFNVTDSKGQQDAFSVAANGNIPAISRPASPFTGLTPKTYNADVIYEKYGFSTSLALNRRDRFLSANSSNLPNGTPALLYTDTRTILDFHAGYAINSYLKVFIDGTNLTNKPIVSRIVAGGIQYPGPWQFNGRRVALGGTVTF